MLKISLTRSSHFRLSTSSLGFKFIHTNTGFSFCLSQFLSFLVLFRKASVYFTVECALIFIQLIRFLLRCFVSNILYFFCIPYIFPFIIICFFSSAFKIESLIQLSFPLNLLILFLWMCNSILPVIICIRMSYL